VAEIRLITFSGGAVMKKITALILTFVILMLCVDFSASAEDKPTVSAVGAVLISADTGEIIYSHNSFQKLPMASTTKIMSALLLLESGNLDEEFVVDSEAIKVEGSSMGLVEGDIVTKYALCCGMLLPSGNDAANAAAVCVAGSVERFAELMNKRAEQIGMTHSYFVTPSGLDAQGHGTSAYDMALLAREALKNETFREICSQESIQLQFGNPPYDRWLKNTNKLLSMYNGVYGVKTGFTDDAGRCLVSACERDGKNLICVTLNDKNDWQDHISMYEYGFKQVKLVTSEIPDNITADVAGGVNDSILLVVNEVPKICTVGNSENGYTYKVKAPPFLYAPFEENQQAGMLEISTDGRKICEIPLFTADSCEMKKSPKKEKGFFEKLKNKIVKLLKQEK
jgi:D-alanyl-D-alanine carboxypeptidase/D-alanyl-D-alanine carboxypeptidase (penicillin-binding protein 5/6)